MHLRCFPGDFCCKTADDGIRTRDLRFTKPLLYQLSYVGEKRAIIASGGPSHKRAALAASLCQAMENVARLIRLRQCYGVAGTDAATEAARKSRQFPATQCARDFYLARLGNARSVRGMAQN